MPPRDGTISTGYKLEWSRWEQMRVTNYLAWQAALVRDYRGPNQFVTQDLGGVMKRDVNELEESKTLDVVADNPTMPPRTTSTARTRPSRVTTPAR